MTAVLEKKLSAAWKQVGPILSIDSNASYRHASRLLDDLTDEIGDNTSHPMAGLMDTLGTLVEAWEEEHQPIPTAAPRQVLAYLMKEHGLKQTDMKELGSQGIVSELLAGKRELNVRQVKALAKRFKVSAAAFI